MTQHQVPVSESTVRQLLQRDDGLTELVGVVPNQILDARITEQLQAGRYEHTDI